MRFFSVGIVFVSVFICIVVSRWRETCPAGHHCINVYNCTYFSERLKIYPRPLPHHFIKDLIKHHCGFEGDDIPQVCCKIPSTPPTFRFPKIKREEPPDVTEHKNLKLLPMDTCGDVSHHYRITSGSIADYEEFPWMALLLYQSGTTIDYKCGGTVINERYVLTAAHCVKDPSLVGVRLGEYDLMRNFDCDRNVHFCPTTQDFFIESPILIHPKHSNRNLNHDIAMLRLATPADFSYGNVKPICLPIGANARINLTGQYGTVTGWGFTEKRLRSTILRKITVPVVPTNTCRRSYKRLVNITKEHICAGDDSGSDSCGGDSGGPLQFIKKVGSDGRFVQYGIVSFGPKTCGATGRPGIYTNVAYHMDWILDNLKED